MLIGKTYISLVSHCSSRALNDIIRQVNLTKCMKLKDDLLGMFALGEWLIMYRTS